MIQPVTLTDQKAAGRKKIATYFVADSLQMLLTGRKWWCSYRCWCL